MLSFLVSLSKIDFFHAAGSATRSSLTHSLTHSLHPVANLPTHHNFIGFFDVVLFSQKTNPFEATKNEAQAWQINQQRPGPGKTNQPHPGRSTFTFKKMMAWWITGWWLNPHRVAHFQPSYLLWKMNIHGSSATIPTAQIIRASWRNHEKAGTKTSDPESNLTFVMNG